MKFQWTIPNMLTLSRIAMVPFISALAFSSTPWPIFWALFLFGVSALTDSLDGYLARRLKQESEFGAYIDPLADKILVWGVYAVLSFKPELVIPFWMVLIIIARDVTVTWLRSHSDRRGIKFKTSFLAKAKTFVQMIAIALILAYLLILHMISPVIVQSQETAAVVLDKSLSGWGVFLSLLPFGMTAFTALLTVISGIDYALSYRKARRIQNNG